MDGSSTREGSENALVPLPEVLEFTGEFGPELTLFTPFCNWLSQAGLLRNRRIKTYRGMRCFYDGLDCLEIIEKDEPRTWQPAAERAAWLPVRSEHDFGGLGHPPQHVYSDLRTRFRPFPLLPDVAAGGKPLLIVHNKHTIEWGGAPVNVIPLGTLATIFRRLQSDFTIVYIRHGMAPMNPDYSEDHNTLLPFGDAKLLRDYPLVFCFDELYDAHRLQGGSQDINTFKNVLYSRCYHFISSQGGGTSQIALFSGSLLAILHRRGREEKWSYLTGPHTFMAAVPPILAICLNERELTSALRLFEGTRVADDRVELSPGSETQLAQLSPRSVAERRSRSNAERRRQSSPKASRPDDLAIVACYFNPCNYRALTRNLTIFLRRLNERNLPVFVAELVFPGQAPVLGESDRAVRASHFTASDVMWHKERLLNLMIARLPSRYTKIAWLDADVIFADERWYERASAMLETYDLVQLFDQVCALDNAGNEIARDESLASYIERGEPDPFNFPKFRNRTGLAWSAKRSVLADHGLFDVMILGGADKYIALAAYGAADEAAKSELQRLSPGLKRALDSWSERFHAATRGEVGYLPTTVLQLGHGRLEHRRHVQRSEILRKHDFDPETDIAAGELGVWRWSSDKPLLHEEIARYFEGRAEDG